MLSRSVGPILLELHGDREQVCERVVVGTKIEPEHSVPAAPEQVVPARTIELVEWRCGSLLSPEPPVHNPNINAPTAPVVEATEHQVDWGKVGELLDAE